MKALARAPWGAKLGLLVVALSLAAALFAPSLAPYDPAELGGEVWAPLDAAHLLGTDQLGRDLLSRLLYGGRLTIGLALATTTLAVAAGVPLGFAAATVGGRVDQALARLADVLMAVPTLITALLVLAVVGTSLPALVLVTAGVEAPRVFRVARALAADVAARDHVEAARLRGERLPWLLAREILPIAAPPLAAELGLRFCFAILFISALSFLGLGVQPPAADWGGMVRENAPAINFGLTAPLVPAAAIATLTVAVNLVVDWLLPAGVRRDRELDR